MIAIVRLSVIGFVILTIVYWIVSAYVRSIRRGKLEREFDEGIRDVDRDMFIEKGLKEYDRSLRRKLVLGVYVVPVLVVSALIYILNFM